MPIPGPLPASVLLLDDGTGTFPTDISDYLDRGAGLSLSGYGRQDEFSQAQAASISLTLRNDDGIFTTGALALSPGMKIRWQEKDSVGVTHDRFTGRISSVDLGWDGAPGFKADVTVTAVDAFADLTRRPLRSMLEQEILADSPTAYYTLSEPSGSTSAGDTSGHTNPVLKSSGSGAAVSFGNGTGPVDGLSAVTLSGGKYLRATSSSFLGTGSFSVVVFFSTTATPFAGEVILDLSYPPAANGDICRLEVDSLGQFRATVWGSSNPAAVVNDGAVHCAVVTFDGSTIRVYIDGSLSGTPSPPVLTPTQPCTRLTLGYFPAPYSTGAMYDVFSGSISHAAIFDGVTLTAAQAANIADVLNGFTETTDARLTRLAGYAGLTATTTTGSGQTVGFQATSGSSLFDAMQAVATAEGGVLFVAGSGDLQMQGRSYRAKKTTPTLTIGAGDPGVDTTPTLDTEQKINQASVTRTGGAEQVVKAPELSDPNAPVYDTSLELIVDNDDDALTAATWIVAKHTTPGVRISTLTLDLLTSPNAADFLALQIGDRISLSGLPGQMFANATDYTVEGWSQTRSVTDATLTLNLLPWSLSEALVLDDAAQGLLDTNSLGY